MQTSVAMNEPSHIDLAHLDKYVAGDVALRDEILTIFVDQVEFLLEQFNIDQSDEDWRNTAHALKGASRGVGAWALGDLAEEVEGLIEDAPGKLEKRAGLLVSIRSLAEEIAKEAISIRDAN
ncbi:MAG: Hpt domain-containing protein [Marinicaulis sp.]|nr:Hpt domain-containing protein [Marinicaulis sp.]